VTLPRCILVAVDLADCSKTALRFAARFARHASATLHVMHALDPHVSAAAERRGANLASESEDELRRLVGDTWPAAQCALHFDVVVGERVPSIVHVAERECADLIVMGAHGTSPVRHRMLGSTAEGVLHTSGVSVLVVPDSWEPVTPSECDLRGEGPIIAGVDFCIPAIEAATDAATLAQLLGTELILVHVLPTIRVLPRWREHAEAALAERSCELNRQVQRLAEHLKAIAPVQLLMEEGRVADCLAGTARSQPHALVVVGRSVHPHGTAIPGATAYRVLCDAQRPLLMHVAR
jgi:nucleotide-binding universal stress UspA family protein